MKYIAIPVLVYIPESNFGIDHTLQDCEQEIMDVLRMIPGARPFIAEDFGNGAIFDDGEPLSAEIKAVCGHFASYHAPANFNGSTVHTVANLREPEWNASPCPSDPDNVWINDDTGKVLSLPNHQTYKNYSIMKLISIAENIARSVLYGLSWITDQSPGHASAAFSRETLAHMAACRISQEITGESTPTADIMDILLENLDRDTFISRFREYAHDWSTTFNGVPSVWVAGFVDESSGGFEWRIDLDEIEAVRDKWLASGFPSESLQISDARLVNLSSIGLSGKCSEPDVTSAIDRHPELWEVNESGGIEI